MVTEIVDLDLGSNSSFKIATMEGDIRSRFIEFHLSYNGEVFSLQNKSVKCRYINGKTTEEVNLVIDDYVNGVCTLEIPYRVTSTAQNGKCELVISQSGEILSTIPFSVEVTKSLVKSTIVESSSEFGALNDALWKVDGFDSRLNEINSQLDKNVKQLTKKINEVATTGTTIEVLKNTTETYMQEKINDGTIANLTIKRDSITGDRLKNKTIYANKVNFLSSLNLFDGEYLKGYYLTGDSSYKAIRRDANFSLIALNVDSGTQYSFLTSDIGAEDGSYWFKIMSSTKTVREIIDNVPLSTSENLQLDGSLLWQNTSASFTSGVRLTTGANDKSIYILVSKYKEPYFEVLKGSYTTMQYTSFKEAAKPTGIDVFDTTQSYSMSGGILYEFIKTGETSIEIWQQGEKGFIKYTYFKHTDSDIGNDVWRLKDIYLYDKNKSNKRTVSDLYVDQEGVLKIQGQTDYSGGVHGDEIGVSFNVFINDKTVDFSSLAVGFRRYCKSIKFIIESNINLQDSSTKAFTKYKQAWFDKDGFHVNNRWKAVNTVTLEHVRGILLSVDKSVINKYYDSIAFMTPRAVPSSQTGSIHDNRMTETFYCGNSFSAHVWCGVRGGDSSKYDANITDFGNRLKSYFDCYVGQKINANEYVYCQNNFKLEC